MIYDFLIIGGGPAGLSAAIYAARFKLNTMLITKDLGGLITKTHIVENYPGVLPSSGLRIMKIFEEQVRNYDIQIIEDEITNLTKENNYFIAITKEKEMKARTVLIATGGVYKKLGVPGEEEFKNRGVSYCAVCDAPLFKNKVVGIIGGGDSAVKEALLLSEYASKIIILNEGQVFNAEPINIERIKKNPKISIMKNVNIKRINGDKKVTGVELSNGQKVELNGVFVNIGYSPNNKLALGLGCKIDDKGYIIIDNKSRTNVKGVYSAGDCTNSDFKQVITASYQGVIASKTVNDFLKNQK